MSQWAVKATYPQSGASLKQAARLVVGESDLPRDHPPPILVILSVIGQTADN